MINKYKHKNEDWKYWIDNLEIERKTPHITCWFNYLLIFDFKGDIFTPKQMGFMWALASFT